ncbi:MAG: hypothetical protein R2724_07590 [Bryobacterales bacterium]
MRWSLLCALSVCLSVAQAAEPIGEPQLTSIAPLGGAPGTSFEATIRGKNLDGAESLWSPTQGVTAEVISIESGAEAKDPDVLHVRLRFADGLVTGAHDLRVGTPRGLSNALRLLAHAAPAILEADGPHDTPAQAQALDTWPATIHGRIAEIGEVDYYAFQVEAGDELLFRSFSSPALDAGLAIYQKTGSWFDPERATRLAVNDEPVEYPGEPTEAVLRYRFEKAGEYLLRVNGFWGYGGVDHVYAVLIDEAPAEEEPWPPPSPAPLWTERDWRRPLDADRMARLAARTVQSEAPADIQVLDADAEIYQLPAEPPKIEGPTLIRGAFEHPGDIDRVRFSAKEGDKLVFEIFTPKRACPRSTRCCA